MYELKDIIENTYLKRAKDYYNILMGFKFYSWNDTKKDEYAEIVKQVGNENSYIQAAFVLYTIDSIGHLKENYGRSIDSISYMNLCQDDNYSRAAAEILKKIL